jgi:hypothetical protein
MPLMRIGGFTESRVCPVCDRTLVMGERPVRYSPDGADDWVDVCPLCQETALDYGWVREGAPLSPSLRAERRRRGLSLGAIFGGAARPVVEPLPEPILRRLSQSEQAIVEATALFNVSDARRTIAGIAKSLGEPNASVVPLSGVNTEVVVTVAWDISWYQYRVSSDAPQPVRLAERGLELDDLDSAFKGWNAQVADDGRILPDVAPL